MFYRLLLPLAALAASSLPAFANIDEQDDHFRLRFGGWSHHSNSLQYRDFKPNENHKGFGFQYWKGMQDTTWQYGTDLFYMKDSNHEPAVMLSGGMRYPININIGPISEVSFTAGITLHNRSSLMSTYYHYIDPETEEKVYVNYTHEIERATYITPMAVATVTFYDKLDLDFTYIPSSSFSESSVAFFRLGWKL